MSIGLDANRETLSFKTQPNKRVKIQEPFINRLLIMNPCFMKPSYHPSQIEPVAKQQAFKFQDPLRN